MLDLYGDDEVNHSIRNSPPIQWADNFKYTQPGLVLEFGVFAGNSIRKIASLVTDIVWGFDTFEGLPEDWVSNNGLLHSKGTFRADMPTDLPPNVRLIKGLFQDTLQGFLKERPEPISLMHMDADLYSSTKYVLDQTKNQLNGAIVVFDEIINGEGYEEHEGRAFREFIAETGYKFTCLGHEHITGASFKLYR